MKKILPLILSLALLLLLPACGQSAPGTPAASADPDVPSIPIAPDTHVPPAEPESYAFDAQYIRTNGYHEDAEYPRTVLIRSRAELDAYYEANRERYDLERKETVYADTTIGFMDACEKYDDAYFSGQDVLFVLLEEGSGSVRHEVTDVRYNGAEWVVSIRRIVPEVGTDDMAEWHIMVEVQMGKVFGKDTPIRVEFVK